MKIIQSNQQTKVKISKKEWTDIGKKPGWKKKAAEVEKWQVIDNEFNRANYKDIIGKIYPIDAPPSYAKVKKIEIADYFDR